MYKYKIIKDVHLYVLFIDPKDNNPLVAINRKSFFFNKKIEVSFDMFKMNYSSKLNCPLRSFNALTRI